MDALCEKSVMARLLRASEETPEAQARFINYQMDKGFKASLDSDDQRDDANGYCSWCGKALMKMWLHSSAAFVCDNWQCQLFRHPQRYIVIRGTHLTRLRDEV